MNHSQLMIIMNIPNHVHSFPFRFRFVYVHIPTVCSRPCRDRCISRLLALLIDAIKDRRGWTRGKAERDEGCAKVRVSYFCSSLLFPRSRLSRIAIRIYRGHDIPCSLIYSRTKFYFQRFLSSRVANQRARRGISLMRQSPLTARFLYVHVFFEGSLRRATLRIGPESSQKFHAVGKLARPCSRW